MKSNPSDSDGSEIQLDVVDVSPGSRPFFEGLAVHSVQCAERLRQAAPHACLFNIINLQACGHGVPTLSWGIERTLLLPARVLLTTMQARVTSLFRQGVLVCRPKSARRGHVKLKSNPSDSDRSEIQVDVVDLAPGPRPFFEESTPAADFGPPLES